MPKAKSPAAKPERLTVRLSTEAKKQLQSQADTRGTTPSQLIRDQLQALTEKHEKLKAANANNKKTARIPLVHRQIRSLQKELAELQ